MSHAALKLVSMESTDRDVLRFERRLAQRRHLSGRVTSHQKSTDRDSCRNRICSVQLLDISEAGLGGIVQEPAEEGTSIVIFFSPHGSEPGFDRYGHIVHCVRCADGYRIGVRFVTRSAA